MGRIGPSPKPTMNDRCLRIAVVHCVAVSGASRDRLAAISRRRPPARE